MNGFRIPRPLGVNGLSVLLGGNEWFRSPRHSYGWFNPLVLVGSAFTWYGKRSAPAAPGWPSGCTFPEVELPGGQSSQAESSTFGCELSFVCRNSQQKLVDPIWHMQDCNCFTVVVSPCFEQAEHLKTLRFFFFGEK